MSQVLSIIIPAYNESSYISRCLENVLKENLPDTNWQKDLIVVDDGSTDNTKKIVKKICQRHKEIRLFSHQFNRGKGAAIKTGIAHARGDILIIQDSDLEYDPSDYESILSEYNQSKIMVVYGSRIMGSKIYHNYNASTIFLLGGKTLTAIINLFFNTSITDQPTGYKSWRKKFSKKLASYCRSDGFEFEVEMTACFSQMTKIKEVPIHYYPRSIQHGKKITIIDFIKSVFVALECRFIRPRPAKKSI